MTTELSQDTRTRPSQLEITRRLMGSSAIVGTSPEGRDISVSLDVAGFVRRLLLFDTYVLYSVRLKEIPDMVRHFGYSGTMELLSSGALEIRCECAQFAEGQIYTAPCPPMTFQFHIMEAHVWEQYLIDSLPVLATIPGLTPRERLDLQSAVVKTVKHGDNRQMFSSQVSPAFENEVLNNEPLVKAAILHVLAKSREIDESLDFRIKFHKEGDDARYRTETDLENRLRLSQDVAHNAIKSALLGVAGLCQRIGEMDSHTALSGFTEEEVPLFRSKLRSVGRQFLSQRGEERLSRVITISGIPEITGDQRINIEQLLRIREEPEAIEFRGWLSQIDEILDSEIRDRVSSFTAKAGLVFQSVPGKTIRLLVTFAIGLPHPILGLSASALDLFVLDRFFKRSAAAAFINELYPSIFGARDRKEQ